MSKITPCWIYAGMILTAMINTALCLWTNECHLGRLIGRGLASIITIAFCVQIAAEYQRRSPLRAAWILLACDALIFIARQILEANPLQSIPYIRAYSSLAALLSLACLLLGVSAMVWAFFRTGLGFRIQRQDVLAVAAIFGCLSIILIRHQYLSEARFPLLAPRYFQVLTQIFIAAAAAAAVLLHRFSIEMRNGKLAVVMKILALHIVLRLLLVMDDVMFGRFLGAHPAVYFAAEFCYDATAWIFALAACYRALMFAQALRQAAPRPEQILAVSLPDNWTADVVTVGGDTYDPGWSSEM